MSVKSGSMLRLGAEAPVPASVEPFLFGGAAADVDEPFNFGSLVNAGAEIEEPFDFGTGAGAEVIEPFMFGSNAGAEAQEPFDFGSSGGNRGVIGTLGTGTASPLLGWRDR